MISCPGWGRLESGSFFVLKNVRHRRTSCDFLSKVSSEDAGFESEAMGLEASIRVSKPSCGFQSQSEGFKTAGFEANPRTANFKKEEASRQGLSSYDLLSLSQVSAGICSMAEKCFKF